MADQTDWWGQNAPPAQTQTQPGGVQLPPPDPNQPSAPVPPGQSQFPSYYNPNDPVQAAVWNAFQQKGIQPRDQADFQYWVDHINQSGGLDTGYQNAGGTGTWAQRMAAQSGGVGDYGGGGGGGGVQGGPGGFNTAPGGWGDFTTAPKPFEAPTDVTMANDPGYMARMKMGSDVIQGAAAARGSLLNGGTLKALERYGQDYGSNEYGNVYNRALGGYTANVNTQRNSQNDYWARQFNVATLGQNAANSLYKPPPTPT